MASVTIQPVARLEGIGEISIGIDGQEIIVVARQGVLKATRRMTPAQAHQASDAATELAEALANAALLAEREGEHG